LAFVAALATKECYEARGTMVGLVTRGRAFWCSRTIPVPLLNAVASITDIADPVLFDFKAPISLKKCNAKTVLWLNLDTLDLVDTKNRVRYPDAETVQQLVAAF
jgi:hypothetical protein